MAVTAPPDTDVVDRARQLTPLIEAEADVLASDEDPALVEMREALVRLPDEYREPLVLQVMMGYTTDEIATHMGLGQGAVLTRLFRARQKLRQALRPEADA